MISKRSFSPFTSAFVKCSACSVVIEAVVDPNEPPMPPKITRDQAVKFAESLLRGEPNRAQIALTVTGDKVREVV